MGIDGGHICVYININITYIILMITISNIYICICNGHNTYIHNIYILIYMNIYICIHVHMSQFHVVKMN